MNKAYGWVSVAVFCTFLVSCSFFSNSKVEGTADNSGVTAPSALLGDLASARALASRVWADTGMHEIDDSTELAVAPSGSDLFVIRKSGTESRTTEVHVLKRHPKPFQEFSLHTATVLHETDKDWSFLVAQNKDVFAIKRRGTGSGSTEVHILSAARNYQAFALQTGTALHEVDESFEFLLASNRDLIAIKKNQTGSKSTEVHVLSAKKNYQEFAMQTGTALHETDGNYEFGLGQDGAILVFKKGQSESGKIEVHALRQEDNYQTFVVHQATDIGLEESGRVSFVSNSGEVLAFRKMGGGTGKLQFSSVKVDFPPKSPPPQAREPRDPYENETEPNMECRGDQSRIRCGLLNYCCRKTRVHSCKLWGIGSHFECNPKPTEPAPMPSNRSQCGPKENLVTCRKESKCCYGDYGVCGGVGNFDPNYVNCAVKKQ